MDQLGLLSGRVYLETALKNYSLAGQYSSKFFDGVREMTSQTSSSTRQSFLQEALAQRDSVTGGLAKGNPSALSAVRDFFRKSLKNAEN